MAPIRRYLRITKHSVLEVRIYLDRPSDAEAWLLRRNDPALPRVIQAVRPLVLPKLREENERVKGKGKARKKGVKDVVVEDDFEVSVFLTELSSRHSLLTKQKTFQEKSRLKSNSGKLTGWLTTGSSGKPIVVSDDSNDPIILREEEEEEAVDLDAIPEAPESDGDSTNLNASKPRKKAASGGGKKESDSANHHSGEKRMRRNSSDSTDPSGDAAAPDPLDDKKLRMNTSYDGFSIYGRILCLVVKRKDVRGSAHGSGVPASSQKMLENWVSTQAAAGHGDEDEETG